jgi:hypothetical protein
LRWTQRSRVWHAQPDQNPFVFVEDLSVDLHKIKKLIDMLEESNLAELEIREGRAGI